MMFVHVGAQLRGRACACLLPAPCHWYLAVAFICLTLQLTAATEDRILLTYPYLFHILYRQSSAHSCLYLRSATVFPGLIINCNLLFLFRQRQYRHGQTTSFNTTSE